MKKTIDVVKSIVKPWRKAINIWFFPNNWLFKFLGFLLIISFSECSD